MPGAVADKFDFFLSRRGSVAAVAQEVSDALTEKGYKVFVQDYDSASTIPTDPSRSEAFPDAVSQAAHGPRHPVDMYPNHSSGWSSVGGGSGAAL